MMMLACLKHGDGGGEDHGLEYVWNMVLIKQRLIADSSLAAPLTFFIQFMWWENNCWFGLLLMFLMVCLWCRKICNLNTERILVCSMFLLVNNWKSGCSSLYDCIIFWSNGLWRSFSWYLYDKKIAFNLTR